MQINLFILIFFISLSYSAYSVGEDFSPLPLYPEDIVEERIDYDDWHFYKIEVEGGASKLTIKLRKISDDADLYVTRAAKPSDKNYLCAPQKAGKLIETCRLNSHSSSTWYVGVYGAMESDYQLSATVSKIKLISQY